MSFDLDLGHYQYEDLARVFQLPDAATPADLRAVRAKCEAVRRSRGDGAAVYLFYVKAAKAVECVLEMTARGELPPGATCRNDVLAKVRAVPAFETYDTLTLIDRIKPKPPLDPPPATLEDVAVPPVAPGRVNALQRTLQTQNLHLHSGYRENKLAPSTDFQYALPSEIKHVVSMRLASIEIPNTRYLISAAQKNNTFHVRNEDYPTAPRTLHPVVIPDGSYTLQGLEAYLNEVLQATPDLAALRFTFDPQGRSVLYSSSTAVEFSFFFGEPAAPSLQSAGWVLGFRDAAYLRRTSVTSEGLFDPVGDRYVFLSVEDYQYNTNVTNLVGVGGNFLDKSVLAKVPMNNEKLALVYYDTNPLCKVRQYNGPVSLNKLHVRILDKGGAVVDLNQMDFSFTLELEVLYENFR